MPCPRKPWYRSDRDWWMVEIDGRQEKLRRGRENRAEAEMRFHVLMAERLANPPVDGGDPTVASVIDVYMEHASHRLGERTFYEQRRHLQVFAESHGRRLLRDCLPYHLSSWLDAHAGR